MRVLIFLALLGTVLAVPKSVSRIMGGSPTTVDQYPYMANMQYGLFGIFWSHFCGGSLLTSYVVLSAAHCFIGDPTFTWRVRLGTSYASSGGTVYSVSKITIHEKYNSITADNDVTLIRLASPAVLSATVQPARIPNFDVPDGTLVTAVGWGSLSVGGPSPEELHHVDIYTINQELCASRYAYLHSQPGWEELKEREVTDGMLCAGILDIGGKDACHGDSGGPLAYDGDLIVGVTSWGHECADPIYPGINVRVSKYVDWIVANA